MTPFELARLRGEVPDDAWYRNNGKSAIENYIERENLNYAQRYNLLKQQARNDFNSNYIVIDKRQIQKEVQKVVNEAIKEINKALKK